MAEGVAEKFCSILSPEYKGNGIGISPFPSMRERSGSRFAVPFSSQDFLSFLGGSFKERHQSSAGTDLSYVQASEAPLPLSYAHNELGGLLRLSSEPQLLTNLNSLRYFSPCPFLDKRSEVEIAVIGFNVGTLPLFFPPQLS